MSTSYTAAYVVLSGPVMRVVVLVLVLAGCPLATRDAAIAPGDDGSGSNGTASECAVDFDCAAAGAKCCDCPTFAEPKSYPAYQACTGVVCPMPNTCPTNVRPACKLGRCELACVASTCALSCADGFVIDAAGCLTCECAQVATRECLAGTDCARVRADCCGCTLGGADTAVPTSQIATHDASLGCPQNPNCPQVDTCAPALTPECVQGACELISGGFPPAACGRPDLMDCPAGTVCTINSDDGATAQGVGVCVPAT
jgi:hypothetical protein